MSTKHLRPEWTERLHGAASARARHAALVAGAHARIGDRSFAGPATAAQRTAATRNHIKAIGARLGTRSRPPA
jgi:hypothetical protein